MPKRKYAKTPWGLKVKQFSEVFGITLKEITQETGVPYSSLLNTMNGTTSGERGTIEKIDAYIAKKESEQKESRLPYARIPLDWLANGGET